MVTAEETMKKIESTTIHATPDGELLKVGPRWKEVIEPITLFKDAIDRVVEAPTGTGKKKKDPIRSEDRRILAEHGIDADHLRSLGQQGSGAIQGPTSFIQLILGPFTGESSQYIKQVRIPPWTALGWKFKHFRPEDYKSDGKREVDKKKDTEREPANATCFGGIPLLAAGEGKNRGSFHRQYNFDQLIFIRTGSNKNELIKVVLDRKSTCLNSS